MLHLLASMLWQTPQEAIQTVSFRRVFRKREVDLYSVVVDSEGAAGSAHYEYGLRLFAERPVELSSETRVEVTFHNLRAKYGDLKAPAKKLFGAANYIFPTTGFPTNYSLAGADAAFVLPILSWYLPKDPVAVNMDFDVPDTVLDGTIHLSGTGDVVKFDDARATIKVNLTFKGTAGSSQEGAKLPVFKSLAVFNRKTGALLSADGSLVAPDGSVTFHIDRR